MKGQPEGERVVTQVLDIEVADCGCAACGVGAGEPCNLTHPTLDRVIRSCEARQEQFRTDGSLGARLSVQRVTDQDNMRVLGRVLEPWFVTADEAAAAGLR